MKPPPNQGGAEAELQPKQGSQSPASSPCSPWALQRHGCGGGEGVQRGSSGWPTLCPSSELSPARISIPIFTTKFDVSNKTLNAPEVMPGKPTPSCPLDLRSLKAGASSQTPQCLAKAYSQASPGQHSPSYVRADRPPGGKGLLPGAHEGPRVCTGFTQRCPAQVVRNLPSAPFCKLGNPRVGPCRPGRGWGEAIAQSILRANGDISVTLEQSLGPSF